MNMDSLGACELRRRPEWGWDPSEGIWEVTASEARVAFGYRWMRERSGAHASRARVEGVLYFSFHFVEQ